MRPRVTESDLALLLLGDNDLVALGAMLSLHAQPLDLGSGPGEEGSASDALLEHDP